MFCKKSFCKIHQILDGLVIRRCPPTRKFKTITCFLFLHFTIIFLFNMGKTSGIRIIFCMRSIGNHKKLYIFKKTTISPKTFPLITINLIKSLLESNSSSFELNMNQRKSIYQNSYIITIRMFTTFSRILINNLQKIIVNIFFVNQLNIFLQIPHFHYKDF